MPVQPTLLLYYKRIATVSHSETAAPFLRSDRRSIGRSFLELMDQAVALAHLAHTQAFPLA